MPTTLLIVVTVIACCVVSTWLILRSINFHAELQFKADRQSTTQVPSWVGLFAPIVRPDEIEFVCLQDDLSRRTYLVNFYESLQHTLIVQHDKGWCKLVVNQQVAFGLRMTIGCGTQLFKDVHPITLVIDAAQTNPKLVR